MKFLFNYRWVINISNYIGIINIVVNNAFSFCYCIVVRFSYIMIRIGKIVIFKVVFIDYGKSYFIRNYFM